MIENLYEFKSSSKKTKPSHGFTLIELLVVIAIIAILAAILFPVFARAKIAAKSAASINNAKQISLAMNMYSNDFDDMFVIAGQWGSQDPDSNQTYASSGAPYMPWTGLVETYLKNRQISYSPMTGATTSFFDTVTSACNTERSCALLFPNYGYNTAFLSPSYVLASQRDLRPLSQTAAEKPAELVMLTELWSRNRCSNRALGFGAFLNYMSYADASPPALRTYQPAYPSTVGQFAANEWGKLNGTQGNTIYPNEEEGRFTAGVAFRFANQTPVAFADGHVKKMSPSQLAIGTDFIYGVSTRAAGIRVLQDGKYLWDPRGI